MNLLQLAVAVMMVAAIFCGMRPVAAQQAGQQATQAGAAQQSDPRFVYRFRPRDTLIGVGQRLLLAPARWPELQRLNGIRNPFNIPPDTAISIPYSWLRLSPDTAVVQSVTGSVTRDGVPVRQGDVLSQSMRIETAADGSCSILFADQSVVTLHKSSVLRLQRLQRVEGVSDGHSAELRLESGRTETVVKPKRDVGRFEIITPVAISAVRGTRFRTGFDAVSSHATAETLEGTVGVAASQGSAAIGAGFGTRVEAAGSVLPPVPLLPAPDLSSLPTMNPGPRLRVAFPAVAQAVSYRVQLATDVEFRSVLADDVARASVLELPAPPDGSYWLRVRAVDSLGIEGRDATREFTQHLLPAAPDALSPAPGTRIHAAGGTLQWSARVGAVRYRLQVARDPQFGNPIVDQQVESTSAPVPDDWDAGAYFWRVAARNSAGESGEWSEIGSFVRRPATPAVEVTKVDARSLKLVWPTRPGERYRLQIARDAGFTQPIFDATRDEGEFSLERPASGTYYARLQSIDAEGVADPFGGIRQFEVPMSRWLKLLLGSTVLLPLLL